MHFFFYRSLVRVNKISVKAKLDMKCFSFFMTLQVNDIIDAIAEKTNRPSTEMKLMEVQESGGELIQTASSFCFLLALYTYCCRHL